MNREERLAELRKLVLFGSGMTPCHVGDVLKEEFLDPLKITVEELAHAINEPVRAIQALIDKTPGRVLTPKQAFKLARYFNTHVEFWMHLRSQYAQDCARDYINLNDLSAITPLKQAP